MTAYGIPLFILLNLQSDRRKIMYYPTPIPTPTKKKLICAIPKTKVRKRQFWKNFCTKITSASANEGKDFGYPPCAILLVNNHAIVNHMHEADKNKKDT